MNENPPLDNQPPQEPQQPNNQPTQQQQPQQPYLPYPQYPNYQPQPGQYPNHQLPPQSGPMGPLPGPQFQTTVPGPGQPKKKRGPVFWILTALGILIVLSMCTSISQAANRSGATSETSAI